MILIARRKNQDFELLLSYIPFKFELVLARARSVLRHARVDVGVEVSRYSNHTAKSTTS